MPALGYIILVATAVILLALVLLRRNQTQLSVREALDNAFDSPQNSEEVDSHLENRKAQGKKGGSILIEQLKQLRPIDQLDSMLLDGIDRETIIYPVGTILFSTGDAVDSVLYLIEGVIHLELYDDDATPGQDIVSQTLKSLYPLAIGEKHVATAYARTRVRVLKVKRELLEQKRQRFELPGASLDLRQLPIPDSLRYSALFNGFCDHVQREQLDLPALPQVALKLRKAIEQNVSVIEAVKIVQLDAAVATKLIQIANSPLYRGNAKITNCLNAVNRLGLKTTRNIVLSASMSNLFLCRDTRIQTRLQKLWQQSLLISSMSFVLGSRTPGINADEAQLAGLISDIGIVPFLYYAASIPRDLYDESEIDLAIPYIRGPIGAYLLKQWDFTENLQSVPKLSEDWYHQSGDEMTLSDIVMLSKLHSYIGTEKMSQVPFINAVPAYSKLSDDALTPEFSLDVLNRSRSQINEIIKFFESPL